ncbi:MAG: hypothetical protein QOI74_372 [Micromonosporaceae bacterium]|nr:hypothetical protein [Micromonosporaceae bacterium]
MAERRDELRAADVDRQFVADKLKAALDEGRLSLHEYDDRLRETYAARTYGDLDRMLADLPGADQAQLVPTPPRVPHRPHGPAGRAADAGRHSTPRWIIAMWSSWITVSLVVNAIWLATVLNTNGSVPYWPVWVMLPWGAVLLAGTVTRFTTGDSWSRDHQARRQARADRRTRRRTSGGY